MQKGFIIIVLSLTALTLLMIAATNLYIDPLAKFRVSDKIYYSSERELKPKILSKYKFDGLVIGTSKITYIQTDDLNSYGNILNAGFSGANIEEIKHFLTELNPKVSWVGLGLDFFMFDSKEQYMGSDGQYFTPSIHEKIKYLISTDTLRYSVKTISKKIRSKPSRYTAYGARNKTGDEEQDKRQNISKYQKALLSLQKSIREPFEVSPKRLLDMKKIQEWADDSNVQLVCWMNPIDPGRSKIISKWLGENRQELLDRFKEACTHFINLADAYPARKYFWNEHPVHYYPSTGRAMLEDYVFPKLKL